MEATVGAGMMLGPILGSFIYNAVGFFKTFAIFGIAMTPISIIVLFALPDPTKIRKENEIKNLDNVLDVKVEEVDVHS